MEKYIILYIVPIWSNHRGGAMRFNPTSYISPHSGAQPQHIKKLLAPQIKIHIEQVYLVISIHMYIFISNTYYMYRNIWLYSSIILTCIFVAVLFIFDWKEKRRQHLNWFCSPVGSSRPKFISQKSSQYHFWAWSDLCGLLCPDVLASIIMAPLVGNY